MTFLPDDMVIKPRFKRDPSPRAQDQEKRRTQNQVRKARRARKKMRNLRLMRRMAGGRGARNRFAKGQRVKVRGKGKAVKMGAAKGGAKLASRAVPVVGWAMLIVDLVMLGHEYGRRFEGKSARLVEAEDARVMWGGMQLDIQTNMQVRDMFESDAGMLRAMGQTGKMNSSMQVLKDAMLAETRKRVVGADMIARDPYFDSADTLLDRAIAKWNEKEIKGLTDETVRKLKANGYGNTKAGR
jgi:hypothetical protein